MCQMALGTKSFWSVCQVTLGNKMQVSKAISVRSASWRWDPTVSRVSPAWVSQVALGTKRFQSNCCFSRNQLVIGSALLTPGTKSFWSKPYLGSCCGIGSQEIAASLRSLALGTKSFQRKRFLGMPGGAEIVTRLISASL